MSSKWKRLVDPEETLPGAMMITHTKPMLKWQGVQPGPQNSELSRKEVLLKTYNDLEDFDYQEAIEVQNRPVTEDQLRKFENYAAEIFSAFGMDLSTESTRDTPRRFINALHDATEGYEGDPKLLKVFDTECRSDPDCNLSQVIEGPIHFFALCEHHALPFYGMAYVSYIPNEKIIGISKLTRLVRLFSKRFTVQERIGQQVADALESMLHPYGIAVLLEAHHLCVEMRGVRETAPITRTTTWRGSYAGDPSLRAEFFAACGRPQAEMERVAYELL